MNNTPPTPVSQSITSAFAELEAKRAARRQFLRKKHAHDLLTIVPVAFTIVIMAYSGLFSMFPILIFYALWLPYILIKGVPVVRLTRELVPLYLLPVYCCLSTLWSAYPAVTIRGGLEFTSMILCTIIMSRIVSINALLKGITLGASLALVATLINGTYGTDYFSGTYSLVGLFGSKNQVGFIAEIGIIAAIVILFSDAGLIAKCLFSLAPALLCLVCLYLSHAGTAVLSLAATFVVMIAAWLITRFPKRSRKFVCAAAIIFTLTAAILALGLDLHTVVLHKMGKDTTLTGRTYLWGQGAMIGLEKPFLGHGYSAFWVQGQIQAERYWYEFGIATRTGFHFHNLFVETFVDLGGIGLLMVAWLIITNCYRSFRMTIEDGMNPELAFALSISCMFLLRTMVEVDFLGPFGAGPLLFYAIIPRLAEYSRGKAAGPATSPAA